MSSRTSDTASEAGHLLAGVQDPHSASPNENSSVRTEQSELRSLTQLMQQLANQLERMQNGGQTVPTNSLPPPPPLPVTGSDYKAVQSLIASPGRLDPLKMPVLTWLKGFENGLMLHFISYPSLDAIPFERLYRILFQVVSPQVQQFLESLRTVFSWQELRGKLHEKYGVTVRQVKRQLWNMKQGMHERVTEFFDRVDSIAAQADIESPFLEGMVVNALLPEFQNQLATGEATVSAGSMPRDWTYDEIKRYLIRYEKQLGSISETPEVPISNGIDRHFNDRGYPNRGGYGGSYRGRGGNNRGGRYNASGRGNDEWNDRWNQREQREQREKEQEHPRQDNTGGQGQVNQILETLPPAPPAPRACAVFEETPLSESTSLTSLETCASIAYALEQAGFTVKTAEELSGKVAVSELVQDAMLCGIETIASVNGIPAAEAYGDLLCAELERVAAISGNIEKDDFEIQTKALPDGTTKDIKRRIRGGNVKEVVRSLKHSITVAKLMAVDSDIREYLLYCAISLQQLLGKPVVLPEGVRYKQLSVDDWSERGKTLAARKPAKFSIALTDLPETFQGRESIAGGSRPKAAKQVATEDEEMTAIPIQRVSHLADLCAANTERHVGAKVMRTNVRSGGTLLHAGVDKRHLTTLQPNCKFLDIVLDGRRLYAMDDTGANFTLVTENLAEELGLEVLPYDGSFTLASGQKNKFVGKLRPLKLQLHDALTVDVDGIRVIRGQGRLQMILGSDILGSRGTMLRKVGSNTVGNDESITVEVGMQGSGELFRLPLVEHETGLVDPMVANIEVCAMPVSDGGDQFVSGEQRELAEQWLESKGYPARKTIDALIQALSNGLPVASLTCPSCGRYHTDSGSLAKKVHDRHQCQYCQHEWKVGFKCVSNPLARLQPLLSEGKIVFADSTFRLKSRGIHSVDGYLR